MFITLTVFSEFLMGAASIKEQDVKHASFFLGGGGLDKSDYGLRLQQELMVFCKV